MMHKTIQTSTGMIISLEEPEENEYLMADITLSLSRLCRFNGHCRKFYSVAQHSVNVSLLLPPPLALEGLLHDAAEAYLGDITSPLKSMMPDFKDIERRFEIAIRKQFGLPVDMHPEVKAADLRMLATEQRDLMPALAQPWDITKGVVPLRERIAPMNHEDAYELFMMRYFELVRVRHV